MFRHSPCGSALLVLAGLLWTCTPRPELSYPLAPLGDASELAVYLVAPAATQTRLQASLTGVWALHGDGRQLPLDMRTASVVVAEDGVVRRLATARLPAGEYTGLSFLVGKAALKADHGSPVDLVAPEQPSMVSLPFALTRGGALVLEASLLSERSLAADVRFEPQWTLSRPPQPLVPMAMLCTTRRDATLSVVDTHRARVAALIPTGRGPLGAAVDATLSRAYVALSDDDAVQVLDLANLREVQRFSLRGGDSPVEVAVTPDGTTLLVVNARSRTVSFVDAQTGSELERVPTGEEPVALVVDANRRRAYVLNFRSSNLTIIDLANRAVTGTVATGQNPWRAALSRDGKNLFVLHHGTPELWVLDLPGAAVRTRIRAGFNQQAIAIHQHHDLAYVASSDQALIEVYSSASALPVDTLSIPAPAGYLLPDPSQGLLWLTLPSRHSVAAFDLSNHRLRAEVEVGDEPYALTLVGSRR